MNVSTAANPDLEAGHLNFSSFLSPPKRVSASQRDHLSDRHYPPSANAVFVRLVQTMLVDFNTGVRVFSRHDRQIGRLCVSF